MPLTRAPRPPLRGLLFLFLAAFAAPLPARADVETQPSWMEADPAAKLVGFHIVSAWNANNGPMNFNGYFEGGLTVVVPVGWRVEITLFNRDGNFPHSIVVTRPYADDAIPNKAGARDAAIRRAYTSSPERGTFANKSDAMRFGAKAAGKYWLFCGVPGHGRGGMWIKLEVSAEAREPHVVIAEGVAPGRP